MNSHDGRELAALMAADGVYEDVAVARTMNAFGVVDLVAGTHALSSDYVIEWVSTQRDGSLYGTEWLMKGTNDGPLADLGLPPTGRAWQIRGASIGELDEAERIKTHRDYWNLGDFLTQLGALPNLAIAAVQP